MDKNELQEKLESIISLDTSLWKAYEAGYLAKTNGKHLEFGTAGFRTNHEHLDYVINHIKFKLSRSRSGAASFWVSIANPSPPKDLVSS